MGSEFSSEIVVDSFAGGGGTSEGIRLAIGRDPSIAINHDALALAMHRVNHPATHHMVEDVWSVDGPDYIIDHGRLEDGTSIEFTLEQQGRMCGNSVCPGMARALVGANYKTKSNCRPAEFRPAPLLDAAE